jgi:hypothetical protein
VLADALADALTRAEAAARAGEGAGAGPGDLPRKAVDDEITLLLPAAPDGPLASPELPRPPPESAATAETATETPAAATAGTPGGDGTPPSCRPSLVAWRVPVLAVAVGKTDTREGARHRRIFCRRGKAKAVVATGSSQMRVFHALLSRPGARYQDLGPGYYETQRQHMRQISHHVASLGAFGYEVTLCRKPAPEPETAAAA